MRLLAWDTSSKTGAFCAAEWDPADLASPGPRVVAEWSMSVDAQHSERLLWGIDELLSVARWQKSEVDVFAVGVGPGSFTGLRIGITTARTLAQALRKPLIGVSSLAALARPAALWLRAAESRTVLVAATDACKGELFALYGGVRSVADCVAMGDETGAGLWKRGVDEGVYRPDELMKRIKRKLAEGKGAAHWAVVGEGRNRYEDAWKALPRAKRLELPSLLADQVQGRVLAQLAWEAWQAGVSRSALEVHPRYVRASDAELNLRAGKLPPAPRAPKPVAKSTKDQ